MSSALTYSKENFMNEYVSVQEISPELINQLPEKERINFIHDLVEIRKRVQNSLCNKKCPKTKLMESIFKDIMTIIHKNNEYDKIRSFICGFEIHINEHLYINERLLAKALNITNARSFITYIHKLGYEKYTRISFAKDRSLFVSLFPTKLPFDEMPDKGKDWALFSFFDKTNEQLYINLCEMLQINPRKFTEFYIPNFINYRGKKKIIIGLLNFIKLQKIELQKKDNNPELAKFLHDFSSFIEKLNDSTIYIKKCYIIKFLTVISIRFPIDTILFFEAWTYSVNLVYEEYFGCPHQQINTTLSTNQNPQLQTQNRKKCYPIPIIKETKNTEKDNHGFYQSSSPVNNIDTFEASFSPGCSESSAEFNILTRAADSIFPLVNFTNQDISDITDHHNLDNPDYDGFDDVINLNPGEQY